MHWPARYQMENGAALLYLEAEKSFRRKKSLGNKIFTLREITLSNSNSFTRINWQKGQQQ